MFGSGFKITAPAADGRMPWSPRVVQSNRMKAKRNKRALVAIGLCVLALMFGCAICGAQAARPKASAAKQQPTPTAAPARVARPMPNIWTPMPGSGGLVHFNVIPLTPTPARQP